jgi:hypothetical protein
VRGCKTIHTRCTSYPLQNRIFLLSHLDYLLYISFCRTRHPLYLALYLNYIIFYPTIYTNPPLSLSSHSPPSPPRPTFLRLRPLLARSAPPHFPSSKGKGAARRGPAAAWAVQLLPSSSPSLCTGPPSHGGGRSEGSEEMHRPASSPLSSRLPAPVACAAAVRSKSCGGAAAAPIDGRRARRTELALPQ